MASYFDYHSNYILTQIAFWGCLGLFGVREKKNGVRGKNIRGVGLIQSSLCGSGLGVIAKRIFEPIPYEVYTRHALLDGRKDGETVQYLAIESQRQVLSRGCAKHGGRTDVRTTTWHPM